MAPGDRSSLAAVNVLGVSPYGRFSGVHLWPVLGVHRGFREQIESLSPEVRSQLEAQYQEPHTVIIHGALQSHVRYSAESLDPETCPAVAEFRVLLRSVPLYQEGTTDPSFIPGRQQFFFAVANVYTKIDVRVPATHPYAKSLAPILARLQACAS